jgi:hypothetical protein
MAMGSFEQLYHSSLNITEPVLRKIENNGLQQ